MRNPNNTAFLNNLARAMKQMKQGAVKGVRLACAHVKVEAQQRVPVDEGNLKASAYTDVKVNKDGCGGTVGFTANYAAAVHEKPMTLKGQDRKGSKGKYWDKQGQATNKFLEKAIDENQSEILQIIHKAAKL
jgi:hypothetical protein